MLTVIRINPDNKLSGYIRIINYPFIIRQHGGSFFSCTFLCSFQNVYAILQKILYINTSISKILAAGLERTTIRLYSLPQLYSNTIRPSRPHYEFMILFDFHQRWVYKSKLAKSTKIYEIHSLY